MVTDLLSPSALADPHPVYRSLREAGPAVWLPEHRAWFVGGYDDVHAAFRDPRLSSDRLTPLEARLSPEKKALLGEAFELLHGWMVFLDPPGHERLRDPVRRAFTPKAVEDLRPFVQRVTTDCVAAMRTRLEAGETVDVVSELAFPLPAIVIAELLGVPAEDRDEFKHWSNQLAVIVFGTTGDPSRALDAAAGSARFAEYFRVLVEERRRRPGDDLISALVDAAEVADPPLGPMELAGACTLLLFGGHETTTTYITHASLALLDHPAELHRLAADPSLVPNAVEELHRFAPPSMNQVRIAAVDHERGGQQVRAGQTVLLGIAAANRDPAVFADPDVLRLDRPEAQRHVGFGYGIHYCLGAPLAKLEGQVAMAALAPLLAECEPAFDGPRQWTGSLLGRGVGRLPIRLCR